MTSETSGQAVETYLASLLSSAKRARSENDLPFLYILAERLVRLTEGRQASPFLFRAFALSGLGDKDGATQDLRTAFRVEPTEAALTTLIVGQGSLEERLKAAIHALRAGEHPGQVILQTLFDAGYTGLIRSTTKAEEVEIKALWTGEPVLGLHIEDGSEHPVSLVAHSTDNADPPFPHSARLRVGWPPGAPWLQISAPHILAIPSALAPVSPPVWPEKKGPSSEKLMIVVPAYRDWPSLERCLKSATLALDAQTRLVVVEDDSPDPSVRAGLKDFSKAGSVLLLQNPTNLGFAGSVNRALALREPGEDVLLLNSDATLSEGALVRLRDIARSDTRIGTLTPLSNNGEDTSVPIRFQPNPEPDDAGLCALAAAAKKANGQAVIDMPNGVGFCLFIRSPVLDAIGGFSGRFDRGYFEDVEFCLRARAAGFRNVCTPGIYVAHAGGKSFGDERQAYVLRNLERLGALYPDYRQEADAFFRNDPLLPATEALMDAFLAGYSPSTVVIAPEGFAPRYLDSLPCMPTDIVLLRPTGSSLRLELLDQRFPIKRTLDDPASIVLRMPGLTKADMLIIEPARLPSRFCTLFPQARPCPPLHFSQAPGHSLTGYERVGLFAAEWTASVETALLGLTREYPQIQLVHLDPLPLTQEIALTQRIRIDASGGVEDHDLAAFIRHARLDGCLFLDGQFGRYDPRRDLLRHLGVTIFETTRREAEENEGPARP